MADIHLVDTHPRNRTRAVRVGSVTIGGGAPIAVQCMAATKTQDIEATVRQVQLLEAAGADLVRIAVDSKKDVEALAEVARARPRRCSRSTCRRTTASRRSWRRTSTRSATTPATSTTTSARSPSRDKVAFLAEVAERHDCALRIGVNCGSVDPAQDRRASATTMSAPWSRAPSSTARSSMSSASRATSSRSRTPTRSKVVEANRRFAAQRPDVPLHLGVTEAGMPPDGIIKTRIAFEQLLAQGIGDTIRVSLTAAVRGQGPGDRGRPRDHRGHRGRPLPLGAAELRRGAEHHLVPVLLARRERGVHRARAARQGDDARTRRRTTSPSPSWAAA